jgi:ribonuclease HI
METAVVMRGTAHIARDLGHGTNNDAEWLALIAAVRIALNLGVVDPVLLGDSTVVVNQANGVWKCRGPELQAHLATFRALADALPRLRIRYIKRSQNLAGIALDAAAGSDRCG